MAKNLKLVDDRDGHEYSTVRIGNQLWTAENMRLRIECNSYMYMDDFVSLEKNGYLYNQNALNTICPPGWHIPTKSDYEKLYKHIESTVNSLSLVQKVSGTLADKNINLQLAGLGSECMEGYTCEGEGAYFWTSSKDDDGNPLYCSMDSKGLGFSKPEQLRDLFSVRLVYDEVFAPAPVQATLKKDPSCDGPF